MHIVKILELDNDGEIAPVIVIQPARTRKAIATATKTIAAGSVPRGNDCNGHPPVARHLRSG